ncbi:MAG: hypothetical protein ACM3ZE_06075 [Myxococcales bacterium]
MLLRRSRCESFNRVERGAGVLRRRSRCEPFNRIERGAGVLRRRSRCEPFSRIERGAGVLQAPPTIGNQQGASVGGKWLGSALVVQWNAWGDYVADLVAYLAPFFLLVSSARPRRVVARQSDPGVGTTTRDRVSRHWAYLERIKDAVACAQGAIGNSRYHLKFPHTPSICTTCANKLRTSMHV